MSFPDNKKIFLLDSIGIVDSGSIEHSSGSLRGANNINNMRNESNTKDVSGNTMIISKIFDLQCTIKSRCGEPRGTVRFTYIWYSKNKLSTLISITQIMKKGFSLNGDNDKGIILKKNDQKIVFNIPICTKERVY